MLKLTEFPRRFATMHKRSLSPSLSLARSLVTRVARPAHPVRFASLQTLNPPRSTPSRVMSTVSLSSPSSPPSAAFSTAPHPKDDADDAFLYGDRDASWFTTSRDPRTDASFPGRDPTTGRLTSIAMPNLRTCSREQILDYFDNSWALTDAVFATLQGEHAFTTPPPHQLRHPLIFYYGHPTVFYLNKCIVAGLLQDKVNPYFEHVFEVGVDEMRWDDMSKNEMHWPPVADVLAYRHQVYGIIRNLIETHPGLGPGHAPIDEKNPLWALCMGLEHERIHLETTSMLIQEHPLEFFRPSELLADMHVTAQRTNPALHPVAGTDYPRNEFLPVAGGAVTIGKAREFPSFGWDNEYGTKTIQVPSCEASKFLISNGEFGEFVRSEGYLDPKVWSEEGWAWRCFRNTKWPQFWVPDGPSGSHRYRLRTLFEVIDMQWDWPAQVNFHEAQAFCKWKNARDGNQDQVVYHLTTEPIHQLLRDPSDRSDGPPVDDVMTPRAKPMADDRRKNLNFSLASFTPVDAMEPTSQGFHDVFGNAWEWCEDTFAALPGFTLHPYYDDFSAPCFDGEHQVIMGGSFMSTGDNGGSKYARYHFRPHFFQHAGFRVVKQPIDKASSTIRLATTDVNAPGPYAKAHPFRTSDVVEVTADASGATIITAKQDEGIAFLRSVQDKSDAMLHAFVTGASNDPARIVRCNGSDVSKLQEAASTTDAALVVVSDLDEAQVAAVLGPQWSPGKTHDLPIATAPSPQVVELRMQHVAMWQLKH